MDISQVHRLVLTTPFTTRSTISYGLIVYAQNTARCAIIQRKHSVEFLLYMKGLYRATHLSMLLSVITMDEAIKIKESLDINTFKHTYFDELNLDSPGYKYAQMRMLESRDLVAVLLNNLNFFNNRLAWTWPKGRISYNERNERESPIVCAKREFEEEVEIELPPPISLSRSYIIETIHTITGRNIEARYFVYVIPEEIQMVQPKMHPEVSDRRWCDIETCMQLVNNGNLFRKALYDTVVESNHCLLQS